MNIDDLQPVFPTLEHLIEVILVDGEIDQIYNYIDYHFENAEGYMRARFYLDTPSQVTTYGPFVGPKSLQSTLAPALERSVTAYLEPRFSSLQRFTP